MYQCINYVSIMYQFYIILALLDFVSRATIVAQASIVHALSIRLLTEVSQKVINKIVIGKYSINVLVICQKIKILKMKF